MVLADLMLGSGDEINIQERQHLSGCKVAVRVGSVVYVSPAMMNLMRPAAGRELQTLMESIKVIDVPRLEDVCTCAHCPRIPTAS